MAQLTVCCHNKNLWHKHAKLGEVRTGSRPRHAKYFVKNGAAWEGESPLVPIGEAGGGGVDGRDLTVYVHKRAML